MVSYQRRHSDHPSLDIPLQTLSPYTPSPYSAITPSPSETLPQQYFIDSKPVVADQADPILVDTTNLDLDLYMSALYDAQKPTIRVQSSTPLPQLPTTGYSSPNMTSASAQQYPAPWGFFGSGQMDTSVLQTQSLNQRSHSHQRTTSASSISSNASASQYNSHATGSNGFPAFGQTENSPHASSLKLDSSYSADQSNNYSNHLPTPSQTPKSESFLTPNYNNFSTSQSYNDPSMTATYAMHGRPFVEGAEDEVPGYTNSSRQSVSSYGNSPATPHTLPGDSDFEVDNKYKLPSNGETHSKVESWIDEYLQFPDEPDMMRQVVGQEQYMFEDMSSQAPVPRINTQQPQRNASLLSPFRNSALTERLQAASAARSQSPSSSGSRAVSPFRNGSPLAPAPNHTFGSPRQRTGLGTVHNIREQQKSEAQHYALKNQARPKQESQPKTISPKEAMLDYNENEVEQKMPLFPDESASNFEALSQQFNTGAPYQGFGQSFDNQSYNKVQTGWQSQPLSSSFSGSTSSSQANFNFAPPAIPGAMYGVSPYNRTQSLNHAAEPAPEFPAHLTSMDSSASEATGIEGPSSTQTSDISKPSSTKADSGTYSCTYHGCTQRFETPQKLQKHKREGHRLNPANVTAGVGSGMSQSEILARNSQAGPHKCERINPTTGKPCNTVFSRPYDLTRHEDTIHNARKQKVRCALCVEEKTFSRNDALTRHMRVVHPEVDFPGKHRRRGGSSHE
jgi:hypothetical protein